VRFWRETAAIVALSVVAAAISNATARRERKLAWLGRPPTASGDVGAEIPSLRAPASNMPRPGGLSSSNPAPSGSPASPAAPGPAASPAATATGAAPHPGRPFVEITSEQAKALFDGGAIFIDARRSAAYRDGHVRGARSISVWESDADEKVKAFYDEGHDANSPIVVYCTGGDCEDSHELAQKLWGVTFDNVSVYRDGFPDWEKRGWPVSRGSAP
jgi:rhodanese-related sulfurtransferase